MSEPYQVRSLSVSQVESFDHKQKGGCERRWWFERAQHLKPEQTDRQSEGEAGHALLARYLSTGERPAGRVKMGKMATGAILKGELPAPGPDLFVEQRFDGQAKEDVNGNWIPLKPEASISIGGVPFDGMIDLSFRRADVPEIWDHKFSSDIDTHAKRAEDLIKTVQMPVYVLAELRRWPDAKVWKIAHHNVSTKGVHSFVRFARVHVDQVHERIADVALTVARMQAIAPVTDQDHVPFNRRSCSAWTGCPHQSICTAFQRNQMQNSPTEEALFAELDALADPGPAAAAPAVTPPATTPAGSPRKLPIGDVGPEIDEAKAAQLAADLDIPLEEARAKLIAKAKKAAAEAAAKAKAETEAAKPPPTCAPCGAALTPENSSKLPSGLRLHIGCPKNAAAHAQTVTPPDAPASNPALASEQPKPAAAEKPKAPRKQKAAAEPDPNEFPDGRPGAIASFVPDVQKSPLTLTYSVTFKTAADLAKYAAKIAELEASV